jgi:hypothetical protein
MSDGPSSFHTVEGVGRWVAMRQSLQLDKCKGLKGVEGQRNH